MTNLMSLYMGDYEVVAVTPLAITIHLGRNVHIHIHPGDLQHNVKPGDKLPLYTQVPYGQALEPPIQ
jgi:hypothetical protein